MAHTPGPWRTLDGDSVVNIVGPEGQPIAATTTKAYYERFDATDKANARLIAAAPDLYEALRVLLPFAVNRGPGGCDGSKRGCPHCTAIRNARAALKSASEGERS